MSAAALVALCKAKGLRLATAESCTGGLVAGAVTDIPGSSTVLTHGFVTYANEAKTQMLGVTEALLATLRRRLLGNRRRNGVRCARNVQAPISPSPPRALLGRMAAQRKNPSARSGSVWLHRTASPHITASSPAAGAMCGAPAWNSRWHCCSRGAET